MTAIAIAALGLAFMCAGGLIAQLVFARQSSKDADNLRDRFLEAEKMAAALQDDRDDWKRKHDVAIAGKEHEHNLRVIAEAQRNEAMRKTRELLQRHAKYLTPDLVDELVQDTFQTPLSLVPTSQQPGNELMPPEDA